MTKKLKENKVVSLKKYYVESTGDTSAMSAAQFLRYVAKNIRGTDIDPGNVIILICVEDDPNDLPEIEMYIHKASLIETGGIMLEAMKQF